MKRFRSERAVFERKVLENDVLGQIRAMLELNGARVHRIVERIPWGRTTSEKGIPDLFGWFYRISRLQEGMAPCRPPVHFFIEVKRPSGKLRPAQIAFLQQANQDGVIAFKAESWEETKAKFKLHGIFLVGS